MNQSIIKFLQKLEAHGATLMSIDVSRGCAVVEHSNGGLSNFYYNEDLGEWL